MIKQVSGIFIMPEAKDYCLIRDRLDFEMRTRDRLETDSDRQRIRERLEATLAGLGELEYLKRRQELLVRSVLHPINGTGSQDEICLSPEEKMLEENILLLRKQLNCLRRRDAGLINQLQELDKQINDLRLDVEKASHEPLETDSRPSSGFYELSDGGSGSLSNSSNSVFSECLSSCRSSTCFCGPLDSSLGVTDGHPKSADDLVSWTEYEEGRSEESNSSTVRRSFSGPYSNSADVVADVHPKYQCDLISKNGTDIYRYPSPLHAVAVQSPMFFQPMTRSIKSEERLQHVANDISMTNEPGSVKTECSVPQSSSWPTSNTPSNKKLHNYIFSLVQRRAQPIRTNKLRTSLNTDPVKGILRQGSICVKQAVGVSQGSTAENSRQACLQSHGTNSLDSSALPPRKQLPKESNNEQLENKTEHMYATYQQNSSNEYQSASLLKKKDKVLSQGLPLSPVSIDYQDGNTPYVINAPNDNMHKSAVVMHEDKVMVNQPVNAVSPKKGLNSSPATLEDRPPLELRSEGSSLQSLDEGQLVNAQYIPAQQQILKLHKGTKNVKTVKVRSFTVKHRINIDKIREHNSQVFKEKARTIPKKCRFPDDLEINKKSIKKSTSKLKKTNNSQIDSHHPNRQIGLNKPISKNGHGREVVLTKPKYKRDYCRWKSSAEISYEESLRCARRRQRREMPSIYAQTRFQYFSPYAYIGSDSEYSAECESLFHSTVVDTSEDEKSNYTTNCFGDSESSFSEVDFVGESTTSSDTDESGGLVWPQFGPSTSMQQIAVSELNNAVPKNFVKIKASHNLKKKILRFRSGSLKLMTTV
ncbi:dapper homolog 1 [Latimeria chalumnae]|uniref:Dishevelled binding antagonist of beta catenin 1 n=1 Tax=Latimeria chalumnae TaxID=7897 RepID=H3BHN4_LATCH|nr:PREDICTED: dapper homolog 1 [Latimeria chalumnae]|eukprot:XP_005986493.1 PREDICTED: dapper homolog 1 [Latimeria chalumnae]